MFSNTRNPTRKMCYVVCHPIYSGRQVCGRTSRGHTGGRSHRISHPPSLRVADSSDNDKPPAGESVQPNKVPNKWRTINSLVHKIQLHGRRGKGTAESVSREKLRQSPQKEGEEILCDLGGLSLSDESATLHEGFTKASRGLHEASKAPPRTLRGGLRTLRGGCIYRRLHEDALEGSRGLLEGSVDELHVPTPVLSTCPLHTNSGCGKERRILIGPW